MEGGFFSGDEQVSHRSFLCFFSLLFLALFFFCCKVTFFNLGTRPGPSPENTGRGGGGGGCKIMAMAQSPWLLKSDTFSRQKKTGEVVGWGGGGRGEDGVGGGGLIEILGRGEIIGQRAEALSPRQSPRRPSAFRDKGGLLISWRCRGKCQRFSVITGPEVSHFFSLLGDTETLQI